MLQIGCIYELGLDDYSHVNPIYERDVEWLEKRPLDGFTQLVVI